MDALSPDLFAKVLNRKDAEAFVDTHLGRLAAHFTDCTFPDLGFDLSRFFEVLRDTVWGSQEDLRLLSDQESDAAPIRWSKVVSDQGVLTMDQLLRLKATRTTIYALKMQMRDQQLRQLAQSIGRTGYFRTHVNAFYTPAGGRGTAIHFDTHDVLALQVHGSKVWTVDEAPVAENLTFEMGYVHKNEHAFTAPRRIHLNAGEALYVPRGVLHDVKTLDEDSLHLVVGLRALNWHDVASQWLEAEMKSNPVLRAPVPVEGATEGAARTLTALSDPAVLNQAIKSALKQRALSQTTERFGQNFASDISKLL